MLFRSDLKVIYASDDEGNDFHDVTYPPAVGSFDEDTFETNVRKQNENVVCIN